jgi:integrase
VGARQNEWFTLDERALELDGEEPVMRVPRMLNKSRQPKSIPLTAREALPLKEQLLARTAGTTLVFPNGKGEQWNRHRVRDQVWQSAIEAAGYESLGFHQLRDTAISLMCRAGYRPEWVAERVGHADGGALILKRYRHLYPSESYAAAPSLDALIAAKTG